MALYDTYSYVIGSFFSQVLGDLPQQIGKYLLHTLHELKPEVSSSGTPKEPYISSRLGSDAPSGSGLWKASRIRQQ